MPPQLLKRLLKNQIQLIQQKSPVPIKPISDEQLEAELAYLKAESGNDVEHPR